MCAEVLSWREESWWERKWIPLGSHSLSPRQVFLLGFFGGLGELLSIPIPLEISGIIYVGKLIPVFAMLTVGFVLGSQRIKMIPVEFQLFYKATKNKDLTPSEDLERLSVPNEENENKMKDVEDRKP
jgi:hypothetical protein